MTSTLRHRRLTANGIKIRYVDSGTGPPVILLHGFPFVWYAWRHQIPVLSAGCRLIVPDLRAYGATERPLTGYDKRSMALGVKSLMDALDSARISCPTLALWGRDSEVAKMVDMEIIWRGFVENLQVAPIADSGYMPHEEQPAAVNQCLLDFFTPWKAEPQSAPTP